MDSYFRGGGNSKKFKKITQKVKGKAPKEICWREMTKHKIGKKNRKKRKKTRKKANFSLFADEKKKPQTFRLKTRGKTKNLSMLKGISINATPRTIRHSPLSHIATCVYR
jgi:hypothetical protein